MSDPALPEEIQFEAQKLSRSGKARFRLGDFEGYVEEVALEQVRQQGWEGLWAENSLWWELMALLFWDVIFAKIPGVWEPSFGAFPSRMQDMPNDLFHDDFYSKRSALIVKRIAQLQSMILADEIEYQHGVHSGKPCRPIEDWSRWSVESLVAVASRAPSRVVLGVMTHLLRDFREHRRGLPDLVLWRGDEFRVAEVKGPGDRLSAEQKVWLGWFAEIGVSTSLIKISSPRQKPAVPRGAIRSDGSAEKAARTRLRKGIKAMPLPAGFREAAKALRSLIRTERKQHGDYSALLRDLYRTAATESFLLGTPYIDGIGPGYNVAASVPRETWEALEFPYDQIGCDKLGLLNKTDRKWFLEAWGEPQQHQSAQQFHHSKWSAFVADYRRGREQQDQASRIELERTIRAVQAPIARPSEAPSRKRRPSLLHAIKKLFR